MRVAVPRAQKEKRFELTETREEFTISMGGYLDESNSVTVGPEVYCPGPNSSMPPYDQIFEPNQYVVIENRGETDVVNPWVVANGQRDWWSVETMTEEIAGIAGGGGLSDRDKMMAVWKFVVDELYDSRIGMSWFDQTSDPVRLFNVYGFEGCVANAITSRRLAEQMGVKSREIWLGGTIDGYGRGRSCGHDIFEAFADGGWHFLDTDLMVFFLNRDNTTVAGSGDLARDIDLLRRSHRNLGLCGRDLPEKDYYYTPFREGQYVYPPNKGGAWMDAAGKINQTPGEFPTARTMALRLRPGEKLVRYWDNVGKNVIRGRRLYPTVRYSNGKLAYRPDLRGPLALNGTRIGEECRAGDLRQTRCAASGEAGRGIGGGVAGGVALRDCRGAGGCPVSLRHAGRRPGSAAFQRRRGVAVRVGRHRTAAGRQRGPGLVPESRAERLARRKGPRMADGAVLSILYQGGHVGGVPAPRGGSGRDPFRYGYPVRNAVPSLAVLWRKYDRIPRRHTGAAEGPRDVRMAGGAVDPSARCARADLP